MDNSSALTRNFDSKWAIIEKEFKIGKVMWPVRVAVTGKVVTPGGGAEMLFLVGKDRSLQRIDFCIEKLQQALNA